MKKINKDKSTENSEAKKEEFVPSKKRLIQRSANPNFPQEYEEQRSEEIHMKPQPYITPKKSED